MFLMNVARFNADMIAGFTFLGYDPEATCRTRLFLAAFFLNPIKYRLTLGMI